jgi:plasmid maintenance system antidote protein VapI
MRTKVKKNKVVHEIDAVLKERGIKRGWLADKINISNGHITNILKGKRDILPDVLDKINKALGTNFKL